MMGEPRDTVLFVDDEPSILNALFRMTDDEPFESYFANSGPEALKILEERKISVIVTDMRMPGMDGLALLKIVREKYPATVRMVLSGYTQLSQLLVTINQGEIFQFIPKPWQVKEELLVPIHRAIERHNLENERRNLQASLAKKNQVYQKILLEMEQKNAAEKKDLLNLKRLSRWIFAFWKRQNGVLAADKNDTHRAVIDRYVELIEEIQLMYIAILPAVSESRTIGESIKRIAKECGGRIVFSESFEQDRRMFAGYPDFLAMVFKILVYLYAPQVETAFVCSSDSNTSAEGPLHIGFTLSPQGNQVINIDQGRLQIGCAMLNELGKNYNISIATEITDLGFTTVRVVWLL